MSESFLSTVFDRTQTARESAPPSSFRLALVPGKGVGCIASRAISLGERLLVEAPLLEISPSTPHATLEDAVDALAESDQKKFFALAQDERAQRDPNWTPAFRSGVRIQWIPAPLRSEGWAFE